jgi:hypothetical protein
MQRTPADSLSVGLGSLPVTRSLSLRAPAQPGSGRSARGRPECLSANPGPWAAGNFKLNVAVSGWHRDRRTVTVTPAQLGNHASLPVAAMMIRRRRAITVTTHRGTET